MPNSRGWGGARPNTGGKRAGAGRPQQRIALDLETANILREIVRLWHGERPQALYTPARVVEDLIYGEMLRHWGPPGSPERARWLAVARGEPGSADGDGDEPATV